MFRLISLCVISGLSASLAAQAEVVNSGPDGFNIRHVVDAPNVAPPVVWAALADIAKWWDSEHTYSGDSRNLSLEPIVRGCFCEKLSLYAGIEHGTVVYAQPAKTLRLRGALGPLQDFGVTGSLTWQIEVAAGGSRITMTYNVSGYADRPLSEWAPIVDEVLVEQTNRLARLVTAGSPEAPKE
jgi:hypothetical protein